MAKKQRMQVRFTHDGDGYIASAPLADDSNESFWYLRRSEDYENTFFAQVYSVETPTTSALRAFMSAYNQGFNAGKKHVRDRFNELMND